MGMWIRGGVATAAPWIRRVRNGALCGLLTLAIPGEGTAQDRAEATFLPREMAAGRWYKGNTHAHTLNSDGDSSPEAVAQWYRDHGYAFLVLSDHNVFTDPQTLAHLTGPEFLLIPGEEVTSAFERRPVHVNGLNLPLLVNPVEAETMVATIQGNVDAIRAVGGVPHINHPNFGWAFGARELAQVQRDRLLEIFNGHPLVHNEGGGGFPGMERIWDLLLTGGKILFGIAVDDAHHFLGEFAPDRSNPGRGWVMVRTTRLTPSGIAEALEAGRFYASTGVVLDEVRVSGTLMSLEISSEGSFRYTTEFIGAGGQVLQTSHTTNPSFTLQGPEPYVRARVRRSDGATAWVQPAFTTAFPLNNPQEGFGRSRP